MAWVWVLCLRMGIRDNLDGTTLPCDLTLVVQLLVDLNGFVALSDNNQGRGGLLRDLVTSLRNLIAFQ
eukprot:876359-Amorphochlora_amoeboformis.AAC.1